MSFNQRALTIATEGLLSANALTIATKGLIQFPVSTAPGDGFDDLKKYYALPLWALEQITEKVQAYVEADEEITPEVVTAITESMVDTFPQARIQELMERDQLTEEKVLSGYREQIREVILDDELALILIFALL